MNRRILGLIAATMAMGLTGCALTVDRIDLAYVPQQGVSQLAGASGVTVDVKVTDMRPDKSKVSSKKNGYGMEMAPIVANEDVSITVRRAIEQELKSRGFQLGTESALVLIAADMTRFYNDHKTGFFSGDAVADLNLAVNVVSKKNELLFSKQIVAQGTEPNIQLASGENAQLALNRALENGMKVLFEDRAFLAALTSLSATR